MIQWRWKIVTVVLCLVVTIGTAAYTTRRVTQVATADCTRDRATNLALRGIIADPSVATHIDAERALRALPVPQC